MLGPTGARSGAEKDQTSTPGSPSLPTAATTRWVIPHCGVQSMRGLNPAETLMTMGVVQPSVSCGVAEQLVGKGVAVHDPESAEPVQPGRVKPASEAAASAIQSLRIA